MQTTFEPISAETARSHYPSSPPAQKKQKMSLTQTYYIAASARSKLGREANRADHDLRLLVGHANLLDSLMVELADAERKQEEWFHSNVRNASRTEESRHVQWADSLVEDQRDHDDDDTDSDSGSDCSSESDLYDEDGDYDMVALPRRIMSAPVQITTTQVDEDYDDDAEEDVYEDFEDDEGLALARVPSQSPPELVHDEESDDEAPPTTPPQPTLEFSDKEAILTPTFYEKQQPYLRNTEYFIQNSTAPLISSY